MGKARVNSYLGGGRYNLTYITDVSKAQARLAELVAQRQAIYETIYYPGGMLDQVAQAEVEFNRAVAALEPAIEAWAQCAKNPECDQGSSLEAEVKRLYGEKARASGAYIGLKQTLAVVKATDLSLLGEIGFIQSRGTDREFATFDAYCADAVPDDGAPIPPSTEVGTVELYGTAGYTRGPLVGPAPRVIVRPAFTSAAYDAERDGIAQPMAGQTVATSLFNALEFPLVACHTAPYFMGRVNSRVSPSQLNVTIIGGKPNGGGPPEYFEEENLPNVVADYMDCAAMAFKENDLVIVEANGGTPRVIGFANGPRKCPALNGWEIAGGVYARAAWEGPNSGWEWFAVTPNGGNLSRTCVGGYVSWVGPNGGIMGRPQSGTVAYYQNTAFSFPQRVRAAVRRVVEGTPYIYALTTNDAARPGNTISVYRVPQAGGSAALVWSQSVYAVNSTIIDNTGWPGSFSPDGTKAVLTCDVLNNTTNAPGWLLEMDTDTGITAARDLTTWGASRFTTSDYGVLGNCSNTGDDLFNGWVQTDDERVLFACYDEAGELLLVRGVHRNRDTQAIQACAVPPSNNFSGTISRDDWYFIYVGETLVSESHINNTSGAPSSINLQLLLTLEPQAPGACVVMHRTQSTAYIQQLGPSEYQFSMSRTCTINTDAGALYSDSWSGTYTLSSVGNSGLFWTGPDNVLNGEWRQEGANSVGYLVSFPYNFASARLRPSTESWESPALEGWRSAYGPNGKFIEWAATGASANSPNGIPIIQDRTWDPNGIAIPCTFTGASHLFRSNDVSKTQFESQSGVTLPYGALGVV